MRNAIWREVDIAAAENDVLDAFSILDLRGGEAR